MKARTAGTADHQPTRADAGPNPCTQEPARRRLTARGGVVGGIAAGLIGIGCCAGPTVAALLGIISASSAVSVADNLFGHWEWAFLLAGALAAAAVVVAARRRARSCSLAPGRHRRFILLVVVSAVATYGALYAITTILGHLAR